MIGRVFGALAAALVVLTGSVSPTQGNVPPPSDIDRGERVCPMIYRPVCGSDGRTYSNSCVAEGAGIRNWRNGQCAARPRPACRPLYRPVCGTDGRNYANDCLAGRAGVEVAYSGRCRPQRACTREYRPVCGADGRTYSNRCMATNAGARVRYQGACRSTRPEDDLCSRVRCAAGTVCENGACRVIEPRAPSGRPCGGIAGLRCPSNEDCVIRERYPDAMGVCRPQR